MLISMFWCCLHIAYVLSILCPAVWCPCPEMITHYWCNVQDMSRPCPGHVLDVSSKLSIWSFFGHALEGQCQLSLCVGSCKCINRERMAPAVLLNLVDSWGTGFDRSDHSLISSSSLHFPGILDIDICCCSYIYDCIHSPWFRPLRPTAGGRNQVRVFRLRLIWVWVHTDMWRYLIM